MIEPRPHLRALARDHEIMPDRGGFVRLDRNERVPPLPQAEFQELLGTLTPEMLSSYPDPAPLYQRLARDLDVPLSCLHLTNGSDAAIRHVFHAYVQPGDVVVYPDPTYAMYAIYSRMCDARPSPVPYSAERTLDLTEVRAQLDRRPRLLALANPDQPTGSVLSQSILRDLAERAHHGQTLLLIDEAYFPCYSHTALTLLRDFDNVVVTRTFSKVGGLAGLRLGFLASSPRIVEDVNRVRGAFEVNAVAIAAGCLILDRPDWGERYMRDIEDGRAVLAQMARDLGMGFPPCPTNFQLLELPEGVDVKVVVDELFGRKYLVKGGFAAPAVRRCIRVTLGDAPTMRGFAAAMREALFTTAARDGR